MFGFRRSAKAVKEEDIMDIVKKYNQEHFNSLKPSIRALDISSECGEFCKEVILCQKYGEVDFVKSNDLEMEYGDLLYSILSFAIENEIDVNNVLKKTLSKYSERENNKEKE